MNLLLILMFAISQAQVTTIYIPFSTLLYQLYYIVVLLNVFDLSCILFLILPKHVNTVKVFDCYMKLF